PGKAAAGPALQAALREVEEKLSWPRARRQHMVLGLAGGFGTTAVLNWLLRRGSQVVAKISNSSRGPTCRHQLDPWPLTSRDGPQIATVLPPPRFWRRTRQWILRTPKQKGGSQYAALVTTLPDLEPAGVADAYDGRARIEATFCQ